MIISARALTVVLLASWLVVPRPTNAAITGQWDFESGDLSATVGQPMTFVTEVTQTQTAFGTTAEFGIPAIDGQSVAVMKTLEVPREGVGGYAVPSGAGGNGGGQLVNRWTVVMDLYYPPQSAGRLRALVNAHDSTGNSEIFVNPANEIGLDTALFHGQLSTNRWHRIAFAVDTTGTTASYIDGIKVGEQPTPGEVDGRWALDQTFYIFNGDQAQTTVAYINSLQVHDEKLSDGLIAALGGPSPEGILRGPPPHPYVRAISPPSESAQFPLRSTVSPQPLVQIVIEDGQARVATNSLTLELDGATVPPAILKIGGTTSVSYPVPELLEPLSVHHVLLRFTDDTTTPNQQTIEWSFAVGPYVALPAGAAYPVATALTRGFVVRSAQAPVSFELPNSYNRALSQLNGTLIDSAGNLIPNVAIPGSNADGSYSVESVNFEMTGAPLIFPLDPTALFPGISGTEGSTDNFALEVVTYLELPAGVHTFGMNVAIDRVDVQAGGDDDGYRLFSGERAKDYFTPVVGQFARTGDPFNDRQNFNEFTVFAPSHGLYPFRLIYWQNGHGANLVWYSVDSTTRERILINDSNDSRAIKTYQHSTATRANAAYVAEVRPVPGAVGLMPPVPIWIQINDGDSKIDEASIKLLLNGELVQPILNETQDGVAVSVQSNASIRGGTNLIRLIYGDANTYRFTNEWFYGLGIATNTVPPVTGQWDFKLGDLSATIGADLEYFDGVNGQTTLKTRFGTTSEFGIPDIDGNAAPVMQVPGDLSNQYGYIMHHGISPNGGGTLVNQYTLIMDVLISEITGPGSAVSLIQINSLDNTDDGDLFWQNGDIGQGAGGYVGQALAAPGTWHRLAFAVDLAATPPLIAKYVDGVKQDDWVQQGLDQERRALKPFAILFADGDQDERRLLYVSSVQIRSGKLSDALLEQFGAPTAAKIPILNSPSGQELIALRIDNTGGQILLSWPDHANGFQLEEAASLTPSEWKPVNTTGNSVQLLPTGVERYYRLRRLE